MRDNVPPRFGSAGGRPPRHGQRGPKKSFGPSGPRFIRRQAGTFSPRPPAEGAPAGDAVEGSGPPSFGGGDGYRGPRPGGFPNRREGRFGGGGGGFREGRGGGGFRREGGFQGGRRDGGGGGFRREGGFQGPRQGGFGGGGFRREGGFQGPRQGGFGGGGGGFRREGGFPGPRREGGFGGGGFRREGGGFAGPRREGGFGGGGFRREGGGFQGPRREGGFGGGGFRREGGFQGGRREGGFQGGRREGGFQRGGPREPRGEFRPPQGFQGKPPRAFEKRGVPMPPTAIESYEDLGPEELLLDGEMPPMESTPEFSEVSASLTAMEAAVGEATPTETPEQLVVETTTEEAAAETLIVESESEISDEAAATEPTESEAASTEEVVAAAPVAPAPPRRDDQPRERPAGRFNPNKPAQREQRESREPREPRGFERRGEKKPFKLWERPALELQTTTLWDYPSQHYGVGEQGSKHYKGATPSYVIWNLLQRYTSPNDTVVDPMCGSGTTLDVCKDLGRKGVGFDIAPFREDIQKADARELPLEENSVSLVFIDPPYSTHLEYSGDENCIGRLDAADGSYYAAMDKVFGQITRVLKPGGIAAVYVSDSFKKGKPFQPIGFELFARMRQKLEPLDIVCVTRHNKNLKLGNFHKAAAEGNFFLRGFNYLFVFQKKH